MNSEKIFEPEYLLLYNSYNYLCQHIKNVINAGGFSDYCETFKALPLNSLEIKGIDNLTYGIAIKINRNQNYMNINNFSFEQVNKIRKNPDIIIPIKPKKLFLKQNFPWPPKVGLNDIGVTCYMNAILQCLCQTEELALYFKYDNRVN